MSALWNLKLNICPSSCKRTYDVRVIAVPQSLVHVPLWGMLLACWIAVQNVNIAHIHVLAHGVGGSAGVKRSSNVLTDLMRCLLCVPYRWVFIYEKGYQSTDTAVSSVFTKMKGVGYTNVSGEERVWDVADYVFPSQVGDWLAEAFLWMWHHYVLLIPWVLISQELVLHPIPSHWTF